MARRSRGWRPSGRRDPKREIAATDADEVAAIVFTSGSTGPPKGVVYRHRNFTAQVEAIREAYGIEPGEVNLPTFPLFALFDPALGMTTVVPEMDPTRPARVDPAKIIEPIREFGVTIMFGSPALLDTVGRWGVEHGVTLPTLRRVISAGAPVSPRVIERFQSMLTGDAAIHTPYGATESLPVATTSSHEILGETRHATDRGAGTCVGRPVPSIEAAVIAIDDGPIDRWSEALQVATGEIGEIVVKGPQVTLEYFNAPAHTALAKIDEDDAVRHRMGDLGYFDESGRLWFCGRKSQRVRTAAGDLFTVPCEAVFNTHPEVFRTALVGVGRTRSQRPVLCVELEKNVAASEHDEFETSSWRSAPASTTRGRSDGPLSPGFPGRHPPQRQDRAAALATWAAPQDRAVKALVTGGGGFLGGAIVRRLVERGARCVRCKRPTTRSSTALGVEQIRGDIADPEVVERRSTGCDVVFHVAAKVDPWGAFEPFHRTNVVGTDNVLAAMRRHGVPKLVFTSTPSVVHRGGDLEGVDESVPYPERFEAAYPQTKAMAERAVLAANDDTLSTVALRPHLIWGPDDTNLVPQLVARARAGRLRFVGDGSNLVDTTYIDNAADAHLLAADRLAPGSACAGRPYFITNGEPWPLKKIVNGILGAAGLPPEERSVSLRTCGGRGRGLRAVERLVPFKNGPPMTRFIARNLATAHWFDISAARRDLGYEPKVSLEAGLESLRRWFADRK